MPFFGKKILRDQFEYRTILVSVYDTIKGARCCGLDHEPAETACQNCGNPIKPKRVMLLCFFNNEVADMSPRPLEDVRRVARKIIDNAWDNRNKPESDSGDDRPEAPKKPGATDPGNGKPADDPPLLPPGGDADDKGRKTPQDKMAKLAERMKKLGWIARAAAMLREARKRAG